MSEDIEFGTDGVKKYNEWVKKNWFTVVAIILIALSVLIDVSTCGEQKMNLVNQCNAHWKSNLESKYPEASGGGWMYVDLNETENEKS